jgi:hypothetical protein
MLGGRKQEYFFISSNLFSPGLIKKSYFIITASLVICKDYAYLKSLSGFVTKWTVIY